MSIKSVQNDHELYASAPNSADFGERDEVLSRYNHCVICHARLHFSFVTDFVKNLTQELVRCPECGVGERRTMHRLQ